MVLLAVGQSRHSRRVEEDVLVAPGNAQGLERDLGGGRGDGHGPADGAPAEGRLGGGLPADGGRVRRP